MKLGPCLCPDFKSNVAILNAPFTLGYVCNPDSAGYRGKPFKFCPWCGKELQPLVVISGWDANGSPVEAIAPTSISGTIAAAKQRIAAWPPDARAALGIHDDD